MGGWTREHPNVENTKMCFGFFVLDAILLTKAVFRIPVYEVWE
jgi:hypothetical protein